jgi:hypothetical protein
VIRWLAALQVLVLVGLPVLVLPGRLIGGLGVVAAALCVGGVLGRSVPFVTAGAVLALVQYALALWLSAAPVSLLMSAAIGIALFLLLDIVDFLGRIHGVAVDPAVTRGQIRYWIGIGGVGVAAIVAVVLGATAVPLALPAVGAPALAMAGAVGTFVGVVRVLMHEGT